MNTAKTILALFALCLATPAASAHPADGHGTIVATYVSPPAFTGGDWAASILIGDAGLFAGGAAGFGLGYAMAGSCSNDPNDHSFFGNCFMHGVGEGAIGAILLGPTTAAAGVTLYGNARGHRGSYWAALGGAYGGSLLVGLLAAATADSDNSALVWVSVFTLPALGSTLGYYLSRDTSDRLVPASGALLDLGGDGVVRLAVPNVSITRGGARGADDTTVSVSLLGGAL